MFQNYIKIAWRNLRKHKGFSFINILGLAVGMATAMLIGLWVWDEWSFDRFYVSNDRLYRVMLNRTANGETTTQSNGPIPLITALRNEIPEIEAVSEEITGLTSREDGLRAGDTKLIRTGQFVGADYLNLLGLPLSAGDPRTALTEPNAIVLTHETAQALFGPADPLNKLIRWNNQLDLKVTGVLQPIPANSSLTFQYLMPTAFLNANVPWMKDMQTDWNNNLAQAIVRLKAGSDLVKVSGKLKGMIKRHNPQSIFDVFLHPVSETHLYGEFKNGQNTGGFIRYVRLFGIVGLLVLLIACINFMNLSTARSEKRAREVGIRKAVGSLRSQLIGQFLSESLLMTGLALILSLLIVWLALPAFNHLTEKQLAFPFVYPVCWLLAIGFALMTGLMAGSYPAFYLSAFNPVRVLKGTLVTGSRKSWPRKVLVVTQFTISIGLIISAFVVYQQLDYARKRPTGYLPDRLVMVNMTDDLRRQYDGLQSELMRSGLVENVTKASSPATTILNDTRVDWSGKASDEIMRLNLITASPNYLKTLGTKLVAGRNFSVTGADSNAVILNQAAVKAMRLRNPIGQEMAMVWNPGQRLRVIGVMENSIIESPYMPVNPLMLTTGQAFDDCIIFRLSDRISTHEALTQITPLFEKFNPAYPFDYQFVSDEYGRKFHQEELVGKLAGIFALLTIFISCLGLFGLAAYLMEQRTKEIGIRKVLGAGISTLWLLLSRDFVVLVLVACLLASPLAAWLLNDWLSAFDYRISLNMWLFVVAGLLAILIALATVSYQSLKAALVNPVKSLKSE
ncbi:ABC transporter permease [Arsenicibacter rosenii]|uniref:ABC transporter permease n=1 Tax=Arsenicibacter rosenii TaxID=1750698 RepID=A0A1S2VDD9_9BACT|nr:ABC transporter permease [Arsenicibacter rosenii]OIN56305.1 hypothetical protein BLX24_25690 [Arsenicibacter rosenii]